MRETALGCRVFAPFLRIVILTLPAFLILCLPSRLSAQGGNRSNTQGSIHVFKGAGTDRSTRGRKPAPTSLNALDLKTLAGMVGSQPGTTFVKLTAQDPSVTNRGALVFVSPKLVEGGENYATWGPPAGINPVGSEGGLALWLRPATGKKYLIDCAVESPSKGAHFVVTGPSGTAPLQVDAIAGGQHLSFVLDATDNKWQHFQINGVGTKNSTGMSTDVEWTFHSCEVTNL
jgi:hypothetical protein